MVDISSCPKIHAHVLLVEDDAIQSEYIMRFLEKMGCSVVAACDGREALSLLDAGAFDLILMDVNMPGMGGIEAAALIREKRQRGAVITGPVIALTSDTCPETEKACRDAGMADFIPKHLWMQKREPDIRRKLAQWLSGDGKVE